MTFAIESARPKISPRPASRRFTSGRIAVLAFLTLAAAFFCIPLYVIIVTSLKTMDEIRQGNIFALPSQWTFDAWNFAWAKICIGGDQCGGLRAGFINSVSVVIPTVIISISMSAITGYALALWHIRWANSVLLVLFICAFVPLQIIMYPLIRVTSALGIYGSVVGIAIVQSAMNMPILTLIYSNFYRELPRDLMSAAMVDSGSFWRTFVEIFAPLSVNITIVVLILLVTNVWNDFLIGLIFGSQGQRPMTTILNVLVSSDTGEATYNIYMAAALLTAAPPLIIYFVLGKFFVQGIAAGAVKG